MQDIKALSIEVLKSYGWDAERAYEKAVNAIQAIREELHRREQQPVEGPKPVEVPSDQS